MTRTIRRLTTLAVMAVLAAGFVAVPASPAAAAPGIHVQTGFLCSLPEQVEIVDGAQLTTDSRAITIEGTSTAYFAYLTCTFDLTSADAPPIDLIEVGGPCIIPTDEATVSTSLAIIRAEGSIGNGPQTATLTCIGFNEPILLCPVAVAGTGSEAVESSIAC